jgi:hypothetical protein
MITWALDHCENIRIRNISIDFERPSISELTFLEISPHQLVAAIHPDSRYDIIDGRVHFYGDNWTMQSTFSILTDTVEGTALYSSFQALEESKATRLAFDRVKWEGDFSQTNYKTGTTLTVRDPYRDHVGAFIHRSANIGLENITIHFMHGLGIVGQFSENLRYSNVQIRPSRSRSIAAFADGMHFSGCRGHILIDGCRFKGLHDDPVNVHGTYLRITEIESPQRIRVRFMHSQTYGFPAFFANDTVAFIHVPSLQNRGKALVKQVKRISDREIQLELSAALPATIQTGDCLENLSWTPSLEVQNCRFEMTNTRGLLITTPRKVIVRNNHFYRTGMYAIQIAGDAGSWFESGAVQDVLIEDNLFEECGYNRGQSDSYAIAINPEVHEIIGGHYFHRNIRILNNRFRTIDGLVLKARSTDGLLFAGNTIETSRWRLSLRALDPANKSAEAFLIENCQQTTILK